MYLVLEAEQQACEDYQVTMLCENHIPGLLDMHVCYIDNKSHYYYEISGKHCLGQSHENVNLKEKDIRKLIQDLLCTTRTLQRFMLDDNYLMLDPELIYQDKEAFYFCYNPSCRNDVRQAFHQLTEFFVREVDYQDEEGVQLAYTLHKATMEDNYDIEEIMNRRELQTEQKAEINYEETVQTISDEGVEEEMSPKENPFLRIWNWAKRRCLEDEYEDL